MGMGFSEISNSNEPTFVETLIAEGTLASPLFSFHMLRAKDQDTGGASSGTTSGGAMCLGCIDESMYTGDLNYLAVTRQGYWEVPLDGFAINGSSPVDGTSTSAAIDSGTTLVYVPVEVAQAFYAPLGGWSYGDNGDWVVPCSTATALESVSMVFNGVSYDIALEDLILGRTSEGADECLMGVLGVDQQGPGGNLVAVVGTLLLKHLVTVFSYSHNGEPAVGFAQRSDDDSTFSSVASTDVATDAGGVGTTLGSASASATPSSFSSESSSGDSSAESTSTVTLSSLADSTPTSSSSSQSSSSDPAAAVAASGAAATDAEAPASRALVNMVTLLVALGTTAFWLS